MNSIDVVTTTEAPAPVGPYVQATRAGGLVFCSGQAAFDPASGQLIEGGIHAQTLRVLKNLQAVLASAGCGTDRFVKMTVFLHDWNDFAGMNEAFAEFFHGQHPPARSTVQGPRWPAGSLVAIEAIALAP